MSKKFFTKKKIKKTHQSLFHPVIRTMAQAGLLSFITLIGIILKRAEGEGKKIHVTERSHPEKEVQV
jgi:hypothetical protein